MYYICKLCILYKLCITEIATACFVSSNLTNHLEAKHVLKPKKAFEGSRHAWHVKMQKSRVTTYGVLQKSQNTVQVIPYIRIIYKKEFSIRQL